MSEMTIDDATVQLPPVVKAVEVRCTPERAFELFTRSIGEWWPLASHSVYGEAAAGLRLGPGVGGQIIETSSSGEEVRWGTVTSWAPGSELGFTWHPGMPLDEATEVTVRFTASERGTQVELEHRGWERRDDSAAMRARYDQGWVPVLARFAGRSGAPEPDPTGRYFVLVHTPGPAWIDGVPFPRQPGVEHHQAHLRRLLEDGRLVIGGPFLDDDGGGFVVVRAASEAEARALGEPDPSLAAGLLRLSVRPWLAAMANVG